MIEQLSESEFLQRVRGTFPISLIYYPGCWVDGALEGSFKIEEIVYLDNDYDVTKRFGVARCKFVIGDFGNAPFRDNFFDAIFYQDNHANLEHTIDMLRTLRPSGIVIYSSYSCYPECIDLKSFGNIPSLRKVELPFSNRYYTVFQKI